MPLAAIRSMNSRYIDRGLYSNVLTRPAMTRSGVRVIFPATSRTRSQGSSLSSFTHFLRWEPDISSIPSKPAWSMRSATGSIIPVVIFSAHRLWCPSRMVVSTNRMVFIVPPMAGRPFSTAGQRFPTRVAFFEFVRYLFQALYGGSDFIARLFIKLAITHKLMVLRLLRLQRFDFSGQRFQFALFLIRELARPIVALVFFSSAPPLLRVGPFG